MRSEAQAFRLGRGSVLSLPDHDATGGGAESSDDGPGETDSGACGNGPGPKDGDA